MDVHVNNFFNNILKFKITRISITKSKNNNKTNCKGLKHPLLAFFFLELQG